MQRLIVPTGTFIIHCFAANFNINTHNTHTIVKTLCCIALVNRRWIDQWIALLSLTSCAVRQVTQLLFLLIYSPLLTAHCTRPQYSQETNWHYMNRHFLTYLLALYSEQHIIYKKFAYLQHSRLIWVDEQWQESKQCAAGLGLLRSRGWVVFLSCCCAERRKRAVRQQRWCYRSRWLLSLQSATADIKSSLTIEFSNFLGVPPLLNSLLNPKDTAKIFCFIKKKKGHATVYS